MQTISPVGATTLLNTVLALAVAFVLGGLIGLERQIRQRTAGLRTNVLVAVGSAIFVDMAQRLGGHDGAVHVVAYVVSGIGFLGAGVIMREEGNVRGLNTAATLWGSAAIGHEYDPSDRIPRLEARSTGSTGKVARERQPSDQRPDDSCVRIE